MKELTSMPKLAAWVMKFILMSLGFARLPGQGHELGADDGMKEFLEIVTLGVAGLCANFHTTVRHDAGLYAGLGQVAGRCGTGRRYDDGTSAQRTVWAGR